MDTSNWNKGFVGGILREEDGTPSFARTGSLLLLLSTLSWVSFIVFKTHGIPELGGPGSFLTTGLLALYGVNKGVTSLKSIVDKIAAPPPQA